MLSDCFNINSTMLNVIIGCDDTVYLYDTYRLKLSTLNNFTENRG